MPIPSHPSSQDSNQQQSKASQYHSYSPQRTQGVPGEYQLQSHSGFAGEYQQSSQTPPNFSSENASNFQGEYGQISNSNSNYAIPTNLDSQAEKAAQPSLSSLSLTESAESGPSGHRYREIRYDELRLDEKPIGRGAFGVVFHGTWRGAEVAVKQLLVGYLDAEALEEFRREAETMQYAYYSVLVFFSFVFLFLILIRILNLFWCSLCLGD